MDFGITARTLDPDLTIVTQSNKACKVAVLRKHCNELEIPDRAIHHLETHDTSRDHVDITRLLFSPNSPPTPTSSEVKVSATVSMQSNNEVVILAGRRLLQGIWA